jgi:hypothetical protein
VRRKPTVLIAASSMISACATLYGIDDRPRRSSDDATPRVGVDAGGAAADESGPGSPADAGPNSACSPEPVCEGDAGCTRVVFVTSASVLPGTSELDGIQSADHLCNALANAPRRAAAFEEGVFSRG